jgi:hypothetical protein
MAELMGWAATLPVFCDDSEPGAINRFRIVYNPAVLRLLYCTASKLQTSARVNISRSRALLLVVALVVALLNRKRTGDRRMQGREGSPPLLNIVPEQIPKYWSSSNEIMIRSLVPVLQRVPRLSMYYNLDFSRL